MTTSFPSAFPVARDDIGPPRGSSVDNAINYWDFVVALFRAKWLIAFCGIALGAIAAFISLNITPTYTATAQILLKTRQEQVINIANVIDNPNFTDTAIVSELAVITSPANLLEVARRLNLQNFAEFNPELETPSPLSSAIANARQTVRALISPSGDSGEPPPPDQIAAAILARKLHVQQFGVSYIIEIEAISRSPRLAAAIANTVAEVYIENQIAAKINANQRAFEWLSTNEEDLRQRLQEAERALEELRTQTLPDGTFSVGVLEQQRGQMTAALVAAYADAAAATATAERFESLLATGDLSAAMQFATSPRLNALVASRDAALQQQATLLRRSEQRGGDLVQIEQTLAEINGEILEETSQLSRSLRARIQMAEERSSALRDQLIALERTVLKVTGQNLDLRSTERQVEAQRAVYDRFLMRLVETRERGDLQEPDASIIANAGAPNSPSAPKRTLLVAIGLFLGCGGAAVLVLAREARRDVFRSAEEAEAKVGLPMLASLPAGLSKNPSWPIDPPRETLGALARLTTLTDATVTSGRARSILITSVLPDEGAAELTLSMAASYAADRARVVVIDCLPTSRDALKRAAALFDLPDRRRGAPSFRVFRPKETPPALRQLPFAEEMRNEIEALQADYDRILLCAPPMLAMSRVLTVGRGFDAAVLTFRWDSTPKGALVAAVEDARKLALPVAGLVMTDVNFKVAAAYGYAGARAADRKLEMFADRA